MKWFLIGLAGVLGSMASVRGDTAGDLYKQGADALSAGQYDVAAQDFDRILTGYPTFANTDDVHLRLGYAYLHLGKYPEAIDRLSKETSPSAKPEYRGTALFYTGLAQFSQGLKLTDKAEANAAFNQAVTAMTNLINFIPTSPTPEDRGYLEEAIYYRGLAEYERDDYDSAEKDLLQVLGQFPASLSRPDYLLRLGSLYALETNVAVNAKKTPAEIQAMAQKALDAFNQVSQDPNALVQANEANMSKAEILYLIAQLDQGVEGYAKALEAYRQVKRKDDMIPLQQERLDKLKADSQAQLQNSGAAMADDTARLIDRETGRLTDLKNGPDPILQALIRIAECYVAMKQPDEARTVLHRLIAHATLTPEQQKEVDFQLLYSYVLGGQTDQANKALDDYLAKHAGDPQADSISYQIAAKLMDRKDYGGALLQADRSLKDFSNGRYVAQVIALKAQALTDLNRVDEAKALISTYVAQNPRSPMANQMLLTNAQVEAAQGDLNGALTDYQKVRDNPSAGELQASAGAGYIQTLQALQRYDDVITESKAFETKFPESKALPAVLFYSGMALAQKQDPGAIEALQNVARRFPKDEVAPYALYFIVTIYQQANNVPAMVQAANDLRTAYPNADLVAQATEAVGDVYVKEKKFDLAVAEYQQLTANSKPDVAATAGNKVGATWLASAKSMGAYQSMQPDARDEAEKRLTSSEQTYLNTLKNFPDQLDAVGEAFQGLVDAVKLRRSWGVLTDADMDGYLGKLATALTAPEMQTRMELARAGLVFIYKNGDKQYPAALDRFKKALSANPVLKLTRQEANQYGQLLIAAKDYPTALQVYNGLLTNAAPTDQFAQADGDYGLGATYLAQGDVANAAKYFAAMKKLPGEAAWHPHILDADYGLALAAEQAGDPNGFAKQTYAMLMQSALAGIPLQAKATLGYGRLLEKAGYGVTPEVQGTIEYAVHYYQQVPTLYGPAVPELSAEGLFDAGQSYEKAGDKANAKQQYTDLLTSYATTAPDWAAKAQDAAAKLGP